MEKLTSLLPLELRRDISDSSPEELEYTCQALLDFLHPLPQFQRKSREVSLDLKKKGNDCFAGGDYGKALNFYSQAVRHAPLSSDDMDKTLLATLYANRASSMHNLNLIEECKRDCGRAILLSPCYVKAWYRRGKANVVSKNYKEAVHDLEVALSMESSSSGKIHIKKDLDIAISYFKGTVETSDLANHAMNETTSSRSSEPSNSMPELQCKYTEAKGNGMISLNCISPGTLIHYEEPLAAIILKSCRETHCHVCLNELPTDVIFCSSCTIPLYCSEQCQEKAIGKSDGTKKYCASINENLQEFAEHKHECGGSNWSAVLPADVVLVCRVMAKDFVHHYSRMASGTKLESHIFSIILSCCLNHYFGSDFPFTGVSAAQLVIIMSQMKVNSMAIVHMRSLQQARGTYSIEKALTSNIEQLRVGQAIYSTGRLFNHSCQPNLHAYFLSRRLLLRSTEPLGQWGLEERRRLLKDQYFFTCQCSGCMGITLPDLLINAFRCMNPACPGVVLESCPARGSSMDPPPKTEEIHKIGRLLFLHSGLQIRPGSCLNCGSELDPRSLTSLAEAALLEIQRHTHTDTHLLRESPPGVLRHAVKALGQLRSVRHAYSRDLARSHFIKYLNNLQDIVAEIFCLAGELESALEHCKASIKILEKLYHDSHIAIGNELVKLASLQLSLGDHAAASDSVGRLGGIFSLYYGPHAGQIYPFLESLRAAANRANP
ncbi:unnamed protein product [Spirodela intermedia]|uniref:Uncharacterized protein n=1 Tax=Spirodela intermedia TaxID=51605 RepID=A0A7I8J8S0_SPIIN|nr:unnamed protein product [Spirodela intermedia]CAA6666587.1 unnamed protein product [Spirodela intermedia]